MRELIRKPLENGRPVALLCDRDELQLARKLLDRGRNRVTSLLYLALLKIQHHTVVHHAGHVEAFLLAPHQHRMAVESAGQQMPAVLQEEPNRHQRGEDCAGRTVVVPQKKGLNQRQMVEGHGEEIAAAQPAQAWGPYLARKALHDSAMVHEQHCNCQHSDHSSSRVYQSVCSQCCLHALVMGHDLQHNCWPDWGTLAYQVCLLATWAGACWSVEAVAKKDRLKSLLLVPQLCACGYAASVGHWRLGPICPVGFSAHAACLNSTDQQLQR